MLQNILNYGKQVFSFLLPEEADTVTLKVSCIPSGGSNSVLPVVKLILTGKDRDNILEAPVSKDGTLLITADRGGYSEAIAIVTNANYNAGMSVTVECSDYPLTPSKPLRFSTIITNNAP